MYTHLHMLIRDNLGLEQRQEYAIAEKIRTQLRNTPPHASIPGEGLSQPLQLRLGGLQLPKQLRKVWSSCVRSPTSVNHQRLPSDV